MKGRKPHVIISASKTAMGGGTGFIVVMRLHDGSCTGFSHECLCRNCRDHELFVPARGFASEGVD